jgi:hypothetical protein
VVGGDVVPVGGSAVVLAIDPLVGAFDASTVGAVRRCGGGPAAVVGGRATAVVVGARVPRGPPRPGEPVVVVPRAVPVTATVEVVRSRVTVTAGRVVVVVIGNFFLVSAGRSVVTVRATVPGTAAGMVGGTVIGVVVVVPDAGTLAASEAPRSSLP